jgi:tRNA dimethylallyltransferase
VQATPLDNMNYDLQITDIITSIPKDRPVLIAGPTASGKSALALAIATAGGGRILNADAMQVFEDWRLLTARPHAQDLERAPHGLYGHVPWASPYSTGAWLREITPLLSGPRPIVVGGTGLNFRALTEGLADIPPTPPEIRNQAMRRLVRIGLPALAAELDPATRAGLDIANPRRVLRAWEVAQHTGRPLRDWQAQTPPPLLPLDACMAIRVDAGRDWLAPRIERRFDAMLAAGVLDEVRTVLPRWDPALTSAQAIGAPELVAHLRGELTLGEARDRAIVATRQYAKRQRTWLRRWMGSWVGIDASAMAPL